MPLRSDVSIELMQQRARIGLPALLGLEVVGVADGDVQMRVSIEPRMLAPNGYLHAATVIALADTACGFACMAHLADGAENFTTIELKTNFLGTATAGSLLARARPVHLGRTTQVWDATVSHVESGRAIAVFRCTQLVLWPKAA
ncbi:MAG TPA: PaaI family thioesterase [Burkholderiaceae bacterium]|jgi:1,4-dihydroxy-2-naphthoyl-CoA hydrolase|nr:PaaI family thioesterase [Burkholderiaceae bacterium]